ncbi:MAG: ADP-ribosylglycohydrolase family protein [Anaerolineales bacterium]
MFTPSPAEFSGCLIGQCLGDALGFPVEGEGPDTCQRYVDDVLHTGRAGKEGRGGFAFGQYTDDSQLARELLQSYVACGEFDVEDYARRIAAIFEEQRIVGRGMASTRAAQRLIQGISWRESGEPSPSAGNGSAMRAGPVGLICYNDADRLVDVAKKQGVITHRDPRCSAGAVVIAGAVGLALKKNEIIVEEFVEQLSEWVMPLEPSFADFVMELPQWLSLPPAQAAEPIALAGKAPGYVDGWRGISPFVIPSVLWSLYSFLRTPDDYWETICTAIVVGGDVDTTAAMAGAISGAWVGLEALPYDLARQVNDMGAWGYEALVDLAEKAYEIKMD